MNSQWPFHDYQISPTSIKMQTQFSFWKHKWINLQSRTSKGHSMITKSVPLLLRCKLHLIRLFCSRIYIIFWEEKNIDIFWAEKNIIFQMFWQKSWNNKTAAILMWTHSGEECTVRNRSPLCQFQKRLSWHYKTRSPTNIWISAKTRGLMKQEQRYIFFGPSQPGQLYQADFIIIIL